MATRAEWLLANEESRIGFGTNSAESIVELLADCIGDTCYVAEAYPAFESEVGSYFSDTYTLDSQILPEDVTFRLVRELEYEEDEEDDPTGPWGW